MTLDDIKRILEAEVIVGDDMLVEDITIACGCDLMSDVLSFVKPGALLLTGLINPQVVRTAEMADLRAICFVRGKMPVQETIELAQSKNIPLLTTPLLLFESCGRLHREGLSGCSESRIKVK
jgi:predicted transcriptional regulator